MAAECGSGLHAGRNSRESGSKWKGLIQGESHFTDTGEDLIDRMWGISESKKPQGTGFLVSMLLLFLLLFSGSIISDSL